MCSVSMKAGRFGSRFHDQVVCVITVVMCLFTATSVFASKKTIPYCIDPNWLPYEALQDGKHIGLSSDYINFLQAHTDYEFKLIKTKNWNKTLSLLKSGRCLLSPMLNKTEERSQFLDFSDVYFTSQNVLVSIQDQPFMQSFENIGTRTLAVTTGYRIEEFLAEHFPHIKTIPFQTEEQGLQAVSVGDVDLFVGSLLSVNSHIHALGLSNLKIAGWGGPEDTLRMGIIKGQEELLSDINAALAQITDQQHFDAYNNWSGVAVIDNTNYRLIWQVFLGGLIILALILARYMIISGYNNRLKQKNKLLSELQSQLEQSNAELQAISQQDALTQLYNRHYINQLVDNKRINYQCDAPLCLIFLDLDHFKNINDEYGHSIGDEVLKEFGGILKEVCSDGELVARWGGEEFVILKKNAEIQTAEALCKNIQLRMSNQIFSHRGKLTCSFGVAQIRPNESLMACFERADHLLYQAKHEGRDRICMAS